MKSKRKRPKLCSLDSGVLSMGIVVGLLLLLTFSIGCAAKKIVLHPIQGADIYRLRPGDTYSPSQKGYFVSDFYMGEVMKAKVE